MRSSPSDNKPGDVRVFRGGDWNSHAGCLRSACRRFFFFFKDGINFLGFRLARSSVVCSSSAQGIEAVSCFMPPFPAA
jgi:hypothetical protein